MFDPLSEGLRAAATHALWAPELVFAAGAVSSVGPCVAPRFIAVAGLTAGRRRSEAAGIVGAFVAGLLVTYAAFGAVASLLGRANAYSPSIYALVGLCLAVGGVVTLWRNPESCEHTHRRSQAGGFGAVFALGASFALVVSPCCTPLVVGILAYTSAAGDPIYGSALLSCFALGHALPILAVAWGSRGLSEVLRRYCVAQAAGVVSGTLMLALAGYYAVLA